MEKPLHKAQLTPALLRSFGGVEEPLVLEKGVSVGHAGNVISDSAGSAGRALASFRPYGDVAMLGGHEADVLEQSLEQRLECPPRLRIHAQHFVVFVDALV